MTEQDVGKVATKLDEQASKKGDLSYSYFHRGTTGSTTEAPAPKKLSQEEVQAQQALEAKQLQQGSSTWNHAGTFEERCVTPWAKERLKEMLTGLKSGGVAVTEVKDITGDANVFVVRGKRRHGFALELTLSWEAEGGDVKGSVKLTSVDSDDLEDMGLTAEVAAPKGGAAESAALSSAKALRGPITEKLEALLDELKQK